MQLFDDYYCQTQNGENKLTSPLEWLAFKNPGDLRAQRFTRREEYVNVTDTNRNQPVGSRLACAACHGGISDAVSRNPMGQATGINSGTRYGVGVDNLFADRRGTAAAVDYGTMADLGATAITNPDYDAANRVVGEVPSLAQDTVIIGEQFINNPNYTANDVNDSLQLFDQQAPNYPNGMVAGAGADLFQATIQQACTGCHLQQHYNNFRAGDYRSAGCMGCHMETGTSGRSASADPNLDKYEPIDPNFLTPGEMSHVKDHRIRSDVKLPGQQGVNVVVQGMSEQSCIACHEGSNRTVAQFKGYRLDQNQDMANANFYPSANTNVTFDFRTQLFGENQFYNNRQITPVDQLRALGR